MDSEPVALPESPAAFVARYAPLPLQAQRPRTDLPTPASIVDAWSVLRPLTDPQRQRTLAAVEIWFGWLDQAHERVQYASDPDGMYWHSILHRLEGDFDNALYWVRRVGQHAAHARACQLLQPPALQDPELHRLIAQGQLIAPAWIEACRRIIQSPKKAKVHAETLIAMGMAEWQALAELAFA